MSELVGGPINLDVCKNCPNRLPDNPRHVNLGVGRIGSAQVLINERTFTGIYIEKDGRSASTFKEDTTQTYLDDTRVNGVFSNCEGPVKEGVMQKIGLKSASCPALIEVLGDPTDATLVSDYIKSKMGEDF
jgi:hypothetical protein